VQRVMTPGGDKNGADINLALDALEMAFTYDHINAFVIVGGDSDFITLVEKLKQYDRKVFVVGGRSFTSQVMQKNCTEFIAYENVVPDRRAHRAERGDRPRVAAGSQSIDGAVPLVKRALKVLADREVTPQLGLLKSTLLQLDSSFSERDYGASSFRDFADKLAAHGLVTLKHQGRSTLVELIEGAEGALVAPEVAPEVGAIVEEAADLAQAAPDGPGASESRSADEAAPAPRPGGDGLPGAGRREPADAGRREPADAGRREPADAGRREPADAGSLGEGVALVRRVLAEAATPPRWPMYPRQFKQFLRAAVPNFDERRFGSIAELMRACQKEGLLKLERDRQGGLRVFAGTGGAARGAVPMGWSLLTGGQAVAAIGEDTGEGPEVHDTVPPQAPLPGEFPDDDIGNRIQGGATDVTRLKLGEVGTRPSPATDVEDPDQQPASNESPAPAAAARKGRRRATSKPAAATRRTAGAAKRPSTRRKKTADPS